MVRPSSETNARSPVEAKEAVLRLRQRGLDLGERGVELLADAG